MKNRTLVVGLAAMAILVVAVAGCSKVSRSNYDKIATGMTLAEVENILGKGTEKSGIGGAIGDITGSGEVLTWTDGEKSITITFVNDKVAAKVQQGL